MQDNIEDNESEVVIDLDAGQEIPQREPEKPLGKDQAPVETEQAADGPEAKPGADKTGDTSASESDDDDDFDSYGDRVKKRISKEVWKRREAERRAQALADQATQLARQLQEYQARSFQSDDYALATREAALDTELERVQQIYKAAYDVGDTDEMFRATQRTAALTAEKSQISAFRQTSRPQPQPVVQQPQYRGPDQKALDWAANNEWFGKDVAKTGAAYAIDAQLKAEGIDPRSDKYYAELDKRLRAEFPALTRPQNPAQQPQKQATAQPVAGVPRVNTERRQVRLSASEVAMAEKLGVPLAEYAKYKKG